MESLTATFFFLSFLSFYSYIKWWQTGMMNRESISDTMTILYVCMCAYVYVLLSVSDYFLTEYQMMMIMKWNGMDEKSSKIIITIITMFFRLLYFFFIYFNNDYHLSIYLNLSYRKTTILILLILVLDNGNNNNNKKIPKCTNFELIKYKA